MLLDLQVTPKRAQRVGELHAVRAARLGACLSRRFHAWGFARPYRRQLIVYLVVILASSVIAVGPALVFERLIDHAIRGHHPAEVNALFALAVGLALGETGLRLVNRYFGSRIGEGLIFDMRVALYDHVHRMPIAFFTRTQTGNLLSRADKHSGSLEWYDKAVAVLEPVSRVRQPRAETLTNLRNAYWGRALALVAQGVRPHAVG